MLQYSTLTQKSEDIFFNYEILIFAYKLSFYAQKIFRAWLILKLYFAMSFSALKFGCLFIGIGLGLLTAFEKKTLTINKNIIKKNQYGLPKRKNITKRTKGK